MEALENFKLLVWDFVTQTQFLKELKPVSEIAHF